MMGSNKETDASGLVKLNTDVPPKNIRLVGTVGAVNENSKLGVSLSQDLESILPIVLPEYRWSKYRSTVTNKRCLTGMISADRFTLDIHPELSPANSVKEIVKTWQLAATSFIMAPSNAIQIFGLDEPETPVPPEEDIPRDYQILSVHIWPAASGIDPEIKIATESKIAEFIAEKAFSDTGGRVLYRAIQLEEDTCGDRTKLLHMAHKIRKAAVECDARLSL